MQIPDELNNDEQYERRQFFTGEPFAYEEHFMKSLSLAVVGTCKRVFYADNYLWSEDFSSGLQWHLDNDFETGQYRKQKATL